MRLLINGFPPTPYALAAYVSLLKEEAGPAPWMIATVNADLRPLFAETIARGGHIRVGLEDTALGTATSNLALVEEAVRIVRDHGPSPPRQPICGRRSAQSPAAPDKLLLRIIACRAARVVQAVGCPGWVNRVIWPGLATSGLLPVPDISLRRAKCRDVTVSDSHTAASRIGPVSGEGLARPEAMAFRLATDTQ